MPNDELPAYLTIAADLRSRIAAGEFPPGSRLPTEAEQARHYGVSIQPVKMARQLLISESLVEGRRGSGVYVRQVRRMVRLGHGSNQRAQPGSTSPFARDAAAAGLAPSWTHESSRTTCPPDVAARLQVEPGEPVMQTRYQFLADSDPIQLSTSWEPLSLTGGTDVERPEDGAAIGVVARMDRIGVRIDESEERVTARSAMPDEIGALKLPSRGADVLVVRRTYYAQGKPVETADIVIPSERYELVYRAPVHVDAEGHGRRVHPE